MYEEEYRRANRNLHPSEELVERAAAGAWRPGSKRRTFRLKVTSAVAAVLALVLLVTGIPGLGEAPAGGPVAGTAYALARPTLPSCPRCRRSPLPAAIRPGSSSRRIMRPTGRPGGPSERERGH